MALKTCVVSYWDKECRHSVEVLAETLHEAVVMGIKAMKLSRDALHLLNFSVAIKEPVIYKEVSGASLGAWLAMPGKDAKQQALKDRLGELLRS